MPDHATQTEAALTAAEDAIFYLLNRLRRDPKLASLLACTETLERLVTAIQPGTGKTVEELEEHYLTPA